MPIRFRCPECQQLMGIARRKAGQTVRCPTCESQVQVPLEQTAPPRPPLLPPLPAPPGPVFERSDFDRFLHAPAGHTAAVPAVPAAPAYRPPPPVPAARPGPVPNVEPVAGLPAPAPGLVLTSRQVTIGAALAVLVVAVAFAAGVLVGRYLL